MFQRRFWQGITCPALGLLVLLLLSGCAGTSIFTPYPAQNLAVRQQIERGRPAAALGNFEKGVERQDRVLYLLEKGRVEQLAGDYAASIESFEKARVEIEQARDRALISASEQFANAVSTVTNDNFIPYAAEPYEKVFLHTFQMVNFLALGDMEAALVEARRARNEQRFAERLLDAKVAAAKDAAAEQELPDARFDAVAGTAYERMLRTVGEVKETTLNGYTRFLSAVLWEATGNIDSAYLDYKKALELAPDNLFARVAAERLALSGGFQDSFAQSLASGYGPGVSGSGEGRVVVFIEEGFISAKRELKLPLILDGRSYTLAMPYYAAGGFAPLAEVRVGRLPAAQAEPLTQVDALATHALMKDYYTVFVRQALRLVAKHVVQKEIQKENQDLVLLFAIANTIIERADLRSWLTLPASVQVVDLPVPAGIHPLTVSSGRGGQMEAVEVPVEPGRITVVRIASARGAYYPLILGPF